MQVVIPFPYWDDDSLSFIQSGYLPYWWRNNHIGSRWIILSSWSRSNLFNNGNINTILARCFVFDRQDICSQWQLCTTWYRYNNFDGCKIVTTILQLSSVTFGKCLSKVISNRRQRKDLFFWYVFIIRV